MYLRAGYRPPIGTAMAGQAGRLRCEWGRSDEGGCREGRRAFGRAAVTGAELTRAEPAEVCLPGAEPAEVCVPGAEPAEVGVAEAELTEVRVAGIAEPGAGAAGVAADDRGDHPLAASDSYARLDPVLRGFLRRRVPPDDVDDVIQAAFVDLWRTRARYDPGRSLEAWALAIARHRAIDHLRARPRPAVPLAGVAERPGDDGREIAARVADAAELRERCRHCRGRSARPSSWRTTPA